MLGIQKMTTWKSDELKRIETAVELKIASLQRDGTLRTQVTIWVVRLGNVLYVRSVYRRNSVGVSLRLVNYSLGMNPCRN
jgi:hypothetical protein